MILLDFLLTNKGKYKGGKGDLIEGFLKEENIQAQVKQSKFRCKKIEMTERNIPKHT